MKELKSFNVRLPYDLWAYLKKLSIEKDASMGAIIEDLIRKMKTKNNKKSD